MASLQTVALFNTTSGTAPTAGLIADASGNLYGTTTGDGPGGAGTVFQLVRDAGNPTGYSSSPIILASFNGSNGSTPAGSLYADASGNLYGTTQTGGPNDAGTVFQIARDASSPTGFSSTPTTLVTFDNSNGSYANGNLIADSAGNLYGTTVNGGPGGAGTVFQIARDASSPTGFSNTPTTLASFQYYGDEGYGPSGLVADSAGNLYGTTGGGGANGSGQGTVFQIARDASSPTGFGSAPNILVTFDYTTGGNASGTLIVDDAGNLYGTTQTGGANGNGTVFQLARDASSPTGFGSTPTALAAFGGSNGAAAYGSVMFDGAGNLYGITYAGGANSRGTVFQIARDAGSPTGFSAAPNTLISFNTSNGAYPLGNLFADGAGNLYGTTAGGGTNNSGTVFRITDSGFVTPVCYCAGTRIRTALGDVPVEDLAIGDTVVTASGQHRPIKWIGTRGYAGRFANANPAVLPVCFRAGSLADGIPARDLWVSPKHAMFLDGVLIPAEHLVNGVTITKAERVESVTYFHVELDSHDVLIAEGAASESFVDDEGRGIFHNAHEFHALYPDALREEAVYCAPRVEGGYVLEAVRARLAARAGRATPEGRAFGALRGHLDLCDGDTVKGWAQDLMYPDAPVCLDVLVDGAVVALAYADRHRPDLAAAGIGDGRHAFAVALPAPLAADRAHTVTLRRSADGRPVGRPLVVGAPETAEPVAA